jgi:hypothetical protein
MSCWWGLIILTCFWDACADLVLLPLLLGVQAVVCESKLRALLAELTAMRERDPTSKVTRRCSCLLHSHAAASGSPGAAQQQEFMPNSRV